MSRWLAVLLLTGRVCFAQGETPAGKQIAGIRNEWSEDLKTKKVEEIVRLYASDGVFLDPTGSRFSGTSALRGLMKQVMDTFDSTISLRSVSVEISGALAFDSGDYQETLVTRSDGKAIEAKGTYLTVLRREADGNWRIIEQMWSQSK